MDNHEYQMNLKLKNGCTKTILSFANINHATSLELQVIHKKMILSQVHWSFMLLTSLDKRLNSLAYLSDRVLLEDMPETLEALGSV